MMELLFRQTHTVTPVLADRFGFAKPAALLYFAQEVSGGHCRQLGVDPKKTGLFWAVIRHRVQVTRLPRRGEQITVETWPMPTTRVAYPRAVAAYDQEGKELFRTISLWVLMDQRTRAMVLPGKSGVDVPGMLRGTELPAPNSLAPHAHANTAARTVVYSELDGNGHMNNTRYLDWVDDLLPSAFHGENRVREFTVSYLAEALEGQQLRLDWGLEEAQLLVDGYRQRPDDPEKYERIFSVKASYDPVVL